MSRLVPILKQTLRTTAFCAVVGAVVFEAEASAFLRRFHVWGHFRPGSWVVLRQGTETLDADGRVVSTSTAETRTTLADVDDACMTFRVQASLEVGGRRIEGPQQELRQGLDGDRPAPASVEVVGRETVTIQGRGYPCRVERSTTENDGRRTTTKLWTSPETAPFELRRETTIVDVATGRVLDETRVEVVSLAQPRRILARSRNVAEVRITHRHPRGQTTSQAYNCPEVPGGLVSQTSEEFAPDGKLLRRTKMELVDFETK
jgi:hypothetical protein